METLGIKTRDESVKEAALDIMEITTYPHEVQKLLANKGFDRSPAWVGRVVSQYIKDKKIKRPLSRKVLDARGWIVKCIQMKSRVYKILR